MSEVRISIVIPVFNEALNVPILIGEIAEVMRGVSGVYEVLLVDDGSTDGSLEVLRALARDDSRLRVLRLARNSGQSAALIAGFRASRGEIVVTLDADLQNDPADIPRLLEELVGHDLVSGVRHRRQDAWSRRVASRIANWVRGRALQDGITDVGCSLKAYRAELLDDLPAFTGMHRFLPALVQLKGARVKEIPVAHRPRRHGEPKYNIRNRAWVALVDLFGVRWLRSRWIDVGAVEEDDRAYRPSPVVSSDEAPTGR